MLKYKLVSFLIAVKFLKAGPAPKGVMPEGDHGYLGFVPGPFLAYEREVLGLPPHHLS